MSTLYLLVGIAWSIALIVWLWHSDAKRRRVAGLQTISTGLAKRRIVAITALLPGAIFAALGDSGALLIWLGSCVIAGWLIAQLRN